MHQQLLRMSCVQAQVLLDVIFCACEERENVFLNFYLGRERESDCCVNARAQGEGGRRRRRLNTKLLHEIFTPVTLRLLRTYACASRSVCMSWSGKEKPAWSTGWVPPLHPVEVGEHFSHPALGSRPGPKSPPAAGRCPRPRRPSRQSRRMATKVVCFPYQSKGSPSCALPPPVHVQSFLP